MFRVVADSGNTTTSSRARMEPMVTAIFPDTVLLVTCEN